MTIDKIKKNINNNLGKRIIVICDEGRNKIYEYTGKVIEIYNNIFIVLDDNNYSKRSVSYCDILTNSVKISFNYKKND